MDNPKIIKALVATAPASFEEKTQDAALCYSCENAEWGTRFVIDFADLPLANQSHPIVKRLVEIAANPDFREFGQIWLESA